MFIVVSFHFAFVYFFIETSANEMQGDINDNIKNTPAARLQSKKKTDAGARPYLELQQIIPFGRSLELIGRVEAGSKLTIDNERVEVAGDGYFKHFTKQFPVSSDTVRLDLKATDLAGRTQTITTFHDFSPGKSK